MFDFIKVTDPLCGMKVNKNIGYSSEYKQKQYFFCSSNCKGQFDNDPEKFIKKSSDAQTHTCSCCH